MWKVDGRIGNFGDSGKEYVMYKISKRKVTGTKKELEAILKNFRQKNRPIGIGTHLTKPFGREKYRGKILDR